MNDRWTKEPEKDDPMELQGFECDGDPDFMIECLIEEFTRLGWPGEKIARMFESPVYPVLHRLGQTRGPEAIRRKVELVTQRCGIFRFRTVERTPEDELVQIAATKEGGLKDE